MRRGRSSRRESQHRRVQTDGPNRPHQRSLPGLPSPQRENGSIGFQPMACSKIGWHGLRYSATHGYVFAAQDTRGRYKSDGVWHMLTDDGPDGVDICAWLAKQPWCDGKIGMIGTSYVGGTQHALALANAPQLATVIPVDAMSN